MDARVSPPPRRYQTEVVFRSLVGRTVGENDVLGSSPVISLAPAKKLSRAGVSTSEHATQSYRRKACYMGDFHAICQISEMAIVFQW